MERLVAEALPPKLTGKDADKRSAESPLRFLIVEIGNRFRFVTFATDRSGNISDADMTVTRDDHRLIIERRDMMGPRPPRLSAVRDNFVERDDGEILGKEVRFRRNLHDGDTLPRYVDA